jgi:rhamnogalacturonyl hydrolase YesR
MTRHEDIFDDYLEDLNRDYPEDSGIIGISHYALMRAVRTGFVSREYAFIKL